MGGTRRRITIQALESRLKNVQISEDPKQENRIENSRLTQEAQNQIEQPKSGGGEGESSISNLPSDIFLDILLRLPIKTLKPCIWVCKSWYHTIHSPLFASLHLKKAYQRTSLLIRGYDEPYNLSLLELQHDHHKNSVNSNDNDLTRLNTQFNTLNSEFKFVGSCNGLLCLIVCNNSSSGLRKTGRIYIGNPIIGEYMAVPPLSQRTRFTVGFGFGVNSAGNEYKVIRLWFRWIDYTGKRRPAFELVGEIYTLGLGTWRSIGNVPYPLNVNHSPPFVNGALHWTIDSYVSMGFSGIIVSFDVGGEEFRPLPHPPRRGRQDNDLLDLCVLGDHLCFLDRDFDDEFLVIWVMKEDGVEESWKILYVVGQPWVTFGRPYHSDITCLNLAPLTLVNDREILFLVNGEGEQLICYDPQTKTFQVLGIQRLPHRFSVIPHVGSFVSFGSAGDKKSNIISSPRLPVTPTLERSYTGSSLAYSLWKGEIQLNELLWS